MHSGDPCGQVRSTPAPALDCSVRYREQVGPAHRQPAIMAIMVIMAIMAIIFIMAIMTIMTIMAIMAI